MANWFKRLTFFSVLLYATLAHTATTPLDQGIFFLKTHWAEVKYLTPKNKKVDEFTSLIKKAEALEQRYPQNAAIKAWHGTILNSYACFRRELAWVSSLKQAKALLESAIKLDPRAENGLAHATLGSIYLDLKDMKKAKVHLLKALSIDPQNIDANFFYGEYLLKEGDEEAAQQYLLQALDSAPRQDQAVADNGRREEILNILATFG